MAAILFPKLTERDLKLTACTTFAHNDHNIPHVVTQALRPVELSFRFNLSRIRFMMLLPAHLGDLSTRLQHLLDMAELEITKRLTDKNLDVSSEVQEQIGDRFHQLFNQELERRSKQRDEPGWHEAALEDLTAATSPAELLGSAPPLSLGIEAMLSAYLTGTWTAFETLSGDLWEAAVNASPDRLAHLKGEAKRLSQSGASPSGKGHRRQDHADSKYVPLDLIQSHRFDVKNKMGSILREHRFEFSRLHDIREAYALAFDVDSKNVDEALTDKAIDALHIVRNVIVHQAGIADDEYIKLISGLKLPPAGRGRPLLLNGETVVGLISPVIGCCKKLLGSVDAWINKHQ